MVDTDSKILYVATAGDGLLMSTDAGTNFSKLLPNDSFSSVLVKGDTIYAGGGTAAELGLKVSYDHGKTFTSFTDANGLPMNSVKKIARNAQGNHVYVSTVRGMSMSNDSGKTFPVMKNALIQGIDDIYANESGMDIFLAAFSYGLYASKNRGGGKALLK